MANLFGRRSGSRLFTGSISDTRGEIDLRDELFRILRGDIRQPQKGHWVILRQFDLSQRSEAYDEVFNEGIGAPAYEFTDRLYLTRRDIFRGETDAGEFEATPGNIKGGEYIYYFEHDVVPTINDQIFELNVSDHTVKPKFSEIPEHHREKYNIKEVEPRRLDTGRIEFFSVFARTDPINY